MKKIPLQAPPDFSSMVPPDVSAQNEPPPPTSDGLSIDNMSPEQANSIPKKGKKIQRDAGQAVADHFGG
jgi:hypothetical protein